MNKIGIYAYKKNGGSSILYYRLLMISGIEPKTSAWQADVQPLNYIIVKILSKYFCYGYFL